MQRSLNLISFIFSLLPILVFAQQNTDPCYAIEWSKNYGTANDDYLFAMEPTSDGGFIAVGEIRAADRADTDIWVQRLDRTGAVIWSRTYGVETANERAKDVKQISTGGFVIFSEVERIVDSNPRQDIQLLELDPVGEVLNEVSFTNEATHLACNLQLLPNGDYLLGAVHGVNSNVWVLSLNSSFETIWSYIEDEPTLTGYTIVQPYGSNILVVNSNLGFEEDFEAPILENIELKILDPTATPFQISEGADASSEFGIDFLPTYSPNSVLINNDEAIIGTLRIGDTTNFLPFSQLLSESLVQTTSSGFTFSGGTTLARGGFSAVTQLPSGENLAAGTSYLIPDTAELDVLLFPFASNFENLQFERFGAPFGGSADDFRVVAVHVLEDGGIVVAANSESSDRDLPGNFGGVDGWIFKIAPLEEPDIKPDAPFCDKQPFSLRTQMAYDKYVWQDGSTDSTFLVTESGTYAVTVSDQAERCVFSDSVTIELLDVELDLGPADTLLCNPDGLLLSPDLPPGTSYTWQDGSTDTDFLVQEAGTYVLTAQVEDCIFTDSITVRYCNPCLEIPNAFTPNDDNLNDTFRPYTGCRVTDYDLKIYNRWGQVVFESTTPNEEWDGEIDGTPAPSDAYVYVLNYERVEDGQRIADVRRGEVLLIR